MNSAFPSPTPDGMTVHWAPLLIHPIADGPECFVAAIAAATETGESVCRRIVDGRRLKAMFRGGFPSLGAVIDVSVASLENHLKATVAQQHPVHASPLHRWSSPFQGVRLGEPNTIFVSKFSDAFARVALLCSAFGGEQLEATSFATPEASRWAEPVAAVVKKLRPQLSNSLNAQLRLSATEHAITFTFFGTSLAANVVVLSSQRMALSMREARAHLWNLSLLADAPDLLIKPARLELLAGVREEGPQVGSAIEELALEAGRRAVSVSRVESSEDAARQIIAMAA